MRDVHIDEISKRVAVELNIPHRVAKKLTRNMFRHIFKVMESDKDRILMYQSPLPQIYKDYDVKKMCNEMIDGERVNYDRFFTQGTRKIHRKHIKRPKFHLLE